MILHALFSGIVFLTGSTASPDAFDKSLALVPPDAGAICAIPNLGLLNNDLGALIDGTNQPAAVLAGRPIEMMKALLGFGAGFDESGSMLLWLQKDPGGSGEVAPVYLVPASDPQSFLTANFTADGTGWRNNDCFRYKSLSHDGGEVRAPAFFPRFSTHSCWVELDAPDVRHWAGRRYDRRQPTQPASGRLVLLAPLELDYFHARQPQPSPLELDG